ncbi:cytosolic sulfotransferase 5-like [Salvia hispanica]|uniref:cytosolic sulfotransferase 5-like n=1 Tax=Salvia hispanica TaxID=49212 RepID=UPI002008F25E|nr:cytosolic sulfotransferase 5-like [Salvia hispanica]
MSSKSSNESNSDLPKSPFWEEPDALALREGFWLPTCLLDSAASFRQNFQAREGDVVLASPIKTGTTWLMAIAHSLLHKPKSNDANNADALASNNPHSLVPTVEFELWSPTTTVNIFDPTSPRLLHTHLPFSLLPASLSASKIVYIARGPEDTLISMWHYFNAVAAPVPLEKAVECFCSGAHPFGPFDRHVAEYWLETRRRPEKVLFVKYEDMKREPGREVSRIAEFLGRPVAAEGEVEEILWRCSLERLKNLEVNAAGHAAYFRKGEVRDGKNYLTPEMGDRIHRSVGVKLEALGLFFSDRR